MRTGRPTSYSQEILDLTREYLNNLPEDEVVHSIEGLADYIKIARSTIYEWISQEDKKDFSDIVELILSKQGKTLVNKGLDNKFSSAITKVMLSKHGYREGIENMGKDGKDLIPETFSDKEKEALLSLLK